MRILVLGVTGMLGNVVFKVLAADSRHEVWGTLRTAVDLRHFAETNHARLMSRVDVLDHDALIEVIGRVHPEVVVNCVGLIKQLAIVNDPLHALPINAMFPHRLAGLCGLVGCRLIHISSDCVFSGRKGGYRESDPTDAEDLYGKSKAIGELHDCSHAITLRTSVIGHELNSNHGLLGWFLSQHEQVKGYAKAIYSGLPAVEFARVLRDFVLPRPDLNGLYHVSGRPISKLDLLRLIASVYDKDIRVVPDDSVAIDRSLDSTRFTKATGYVAPDWPELITQMHSLR